MLVPKRIDAPELLDEHDAPREDMERSLRDLRRFNTVYGGRGIAASFADAGLTFTTGTLQ